MASRCQCSYKYPGDSWDPFVPGPERKCAERPWDGSDKGLCVYHSPQNITSREATQIVWNEALKRCSEGHTSCDFTGWHFPANDDGFKDKTLVNACFAAAVFVGEISFEGTIFKGETRFNSAEFQSDACFRKSRFEQICFFMRTHFSALANFENVDFALLRFDGAVFDNLAIFWEAEFPQLACFAGVKFAEAHFSGITFQQNAEYNAAHFINKGNFDSVEFEKDVYFDEARFDSGADFSKSSFHKKADFSGVKTGSGSLLNLDSGPADNGACTFEIIKEGESAYRAAKQAAANAGNYLGASKYHYAEQVAITWKIRQSGKWGWLFVIPREIFGGWIFGYGEKPERPLLAGLLVIAFFSAVWWGGWGISPGSDLRYRPNILESLYFSLISFTTLGYGDFQPKFDLFRILAGVEAFLGAALMASFIVTLTRKYVR